MSIWLKNTPDEINISDAMKKNITLFCDHNDNCVLFNLLWYIEDDDYQ